MIQVTFAEVQGIVAGLGATMTAAESHGYLCGALCTSAQCTFEQWLAEVVPEEARPLAAASEEPLRLLLSDTARDLSGDDMEFEPFLPEDDVMLAKRTAALSEWCQGFLYGFSTGAVTPAQWPQNVTEIVRDITQISRVETDVGESAEEDEQSYTDVVEYVRVGAQLIFDELHGLRHAAKERH
jgi:uncharacterized protein YgfB (UPF0149 family)